MGETYAFLRAPHNGFLRNALLGAALAFPGSGCAAAYKNTAISAAVAADVVVDEVADSFSSLQLKRLELCVEREQNDQTEWSREDKVDCMGELATSKPLEAAIRAVIAAQRAAKVAYHSDNIKIVDLLRIVEDLEKAVAAVRELSDG